MSPSVKNKMTFVLPLKINANPLGSDLDRVKKILLPSMVKYFKTADVDQFLIIVPDPEEPQVSSELQGFKQALTLSVIPEKAVLARVPGWQQHARLHQSIPVLKKIDQKLTGGKLARHFKVANGWDNLGGWLKQQLLKICVVRMVNTDYYMTLDSDLCQVHPGDFQSLIPDGRAIIAYDAAATHYDWWNGSAKALGLELKLRKQDNVLSVTPELMSTAVVKHLLDYLIAKAKEHAYPTLFEYMSTYRSWTEYTLYWLFLLEFYKVEDYYTDSKPRYQLHSNSSIWDRKKAPDLKTLEGHIHASFEEGPAAALFLVVQSTCIPLEEYYTAIRGHLV